MADGRFLLLSTTFQLHNSPIYLKIIVACLPLIIVRASSFAPGDSIPNILNLLSCRILWPVIEGSTEVHATVASTTSTKVTKDDSVVLKIYHKKRGWLGH